MPKVRTSKLTDEDKPRVVQPDTGGELRTRSSLIERALGRSLHLEDDMSEEDAMALALVEAQP